MQRLLNYIYFSFDARLTRAFRLSRQALGRRRTPDLVVQVEERRRPPPPKLDVHLSHMSVRNDGVAATGPFQETSAIMQL